MAERLHAHVHVVHVTLTLQDGVSYEEKLRDEVGRRTGRGVMRVGRRGGGWGGGEGK